MIGDILKFAPGQRRHSPPNYSDYNKSIKIILVVTWCHKISPKNGSGESSINVKRQGNDSCRPTRCLSYSGYYLANHFHPSPQPQFPSAPVAVTRIWLMVAQSSEPKVYIRILERKEKYRFNRILQQAANNYACWKIGRYLLDSVLWPDSHWSEPVALVRSN
jgi:hypothetical protein